MAGALAGVQAGLAALEREDLKRTRRVLDSPQGARIVADGVAVANFASNDYLGLAAHPRVVAAAHAALERYGAGSGASPLVVGHQRAHQEAEERFAAFSRLPRALLFGSGYAANLGILTALADRHAQIFCDRLDHACLNDGALLSRARMVRYPHADLDALERALARAGSATRIVATDTVFSMDGDLANLPRLLALCERHDAWLVLDDAHGIGVLGATGRGALEHFGIAAERIVYMATLGKALGSHGAFVAAHPDVIEWILQRARTYVFSTALPAMCAAAASAALELLDEQPAIVATLHGRIARFRAGAQSLAGLRESGTAIQPIVLGEARTALEVSQRLLERGFLVPAIRPPTVPEGTSRLRVSLSAAHREEDIDALLRALGECLA